MFLAETRTKPVYISINFNKHAYIFGIIATAIYKI